jgi:hypothetical protein
MNHNKNKNKLLAFAFGGLFVLVGTYNAVVINSESHLSNADVKFVKRLDEIYGVTVPGRQVAATTTWKKIEKQESMNKVVPQIASSSNSSEVIPTAADAISDAVVKEELNLSLVEVINSKKWQNGLPSSQFSGGLSTNNGVIESLSVSLPNGEGVSVSFSEMTGNVFEYDLNGELYSGMMYQVDQHAYMVTLTNGPLEGTRLRFSAEASAVEQEQVAENLAQNNIEVGSFGSDAPVNNPEELLQNDQQMQEEAAQAQAFNFDNNQAI